MLEWLEVRLDVGCDKRLVYEYRIEPLLLILVLVVVVVVVVVQCQSSTKWPIICPSKNHLDENTASV